MKPQMEETRRGMVVAHFLLAFPTAGFAQVTVNGHVRDLSDAVAAINEIRTKRPEGDPLGIGAGLPPYAGPLTVDALDEEIYRQGATELYLTGMRFDDSRRLGRPGPPDNLIERNRSYYPYDDEERQNNPHTPANPVT